MRRSTRWIRRNPLLWAAVVRFCTRQSNDVIKHRDLWAFEQFLDARRQILRERPADPILRHRALQSDKKVDDLIFAVMADDFRREIVNAVNRFYAATLDADAWCRVTQPLAASERASLLYQYGEPNLELAVNRPYALRNRFAFAATHLLHQSNKHVRQGWKDNLVKDRDIGLD